MNLMQYISYLTERYLNGKYYCVKDCAAECSLRLLTHKSGVFRKYIQANAIPEGKDLSLLKAICYHTKLNYLRAENRQCPYEQRKKMKSQKFQKENIA